MSRSTTESEYRELAQVSAEITWIESLLREIKFSLVDKSVTWCDNTSASAIASNPVYHALTKHIELDIHFVRDKVLNKELDVRYIPSIDQIVDCMTKSLSHTRFKYLVSKLGVKSSPSRLRGGVKNVD